MFERPRHPRARVAAVLALALALGGCANTRTGLGYYWQAAKGQFDLMRAAQPVPQLLASPATPEKLKHQLALAQRIRRYAVTHLGLPDNASYTKYADLHRGAAVWNVVAAPPYSLALKTWCFPIAGCVGYRGYYALADAQAEAAAQRQDGLEVAVYPVPAYSTLGWLNWAGGDPLLSTFIGYPEGELARIIFHELAHQVVYASGDTVFNESYATTVAKIGVGKWLAEDASDAARADYAAFDAQRRQFGGLVRETRAALLKVYESKPAAAPDWPAGEAMKKIAMEEFRARYARLRAGWSGPRQGAYDAWVARANNASFGAFAAYDQLVPAFEALYRHEDGDWPRFYAAVRALAALPKDERHAALMAYSAGKAPALHAARNENGDPGA